MSPTLLSKRLQQLEAAGVVERALGRDGRTYEYQPTPACEYLRPLIQEIGYWGQRWVRSGFVANPEFTHGNFSSVS